jgi:hypothetical protein
MDNVRGEAKISEAPAGGWGRGGGAGGRLGPLARSGGGNTVFVDLRPGHRSDGGGRRLPSSRKTLPMYFSK